MSRDIIPWVRVSPSLIPFLKKKSIPEMFCETTTTNLWCAADFEPPSESSRECTSQRCKSSEGLFFAQIKRVVPVPIYLCRLSSCECRKRKERWGGRSERKERQRVPPERGGCEVRRERCALPAERGRSKRGEDLEWEPPPREYEALSLLHLLCPFAMPVWWVLS